MKILRIIYDWPPPWQGLAPHPYELTVSQEKLGHEITVFCGRWPLAGNIAQPQNVKIKSFIREPLPGTLSVTISPILFLYYLFWRMRNQADVIHCHGHFGIWIYLYRLVLKKIFPGAGELKTPMVVHFHNTVAGRWVAVNEKNQSIKKHSRFLSWPLAKLSDKWAVKGASACIFVSETVKNEAIEHYKVDPEKCFVVESGVNVSLFTPIGVEEKEKTRRELNLDPFDKVIVNIGSMVERKNIHLLIESLKLLPDDYKLLLVGPGDPEYSHRLDDLINQLKLRDRVVRAGYTPYPQLPIAFQAADVFVLPSTWEGTPKVVMESLACGVPALVSGFRLSEEITGLYYLESVDIMTIAKGIQNIIASPHRVDLGKIRYLYSWEEKAEQVGAVYAFVKKRQRQ